MPIYLPILHCVRSEVARDGSMEVALPCYSYSAASLLTSSSTAAAGGRKVIRLEARDMADIVA